MSQVPGMEPIVEQVRPGIWSIPVSIPGNPLGATLVYLIESDRGPVLVDAGWQDELTWQDLTEGVAQAGHDISDCYGVLVTHHHPDHHGLAGRVREASGAWVALHPADTALVRKHRGWSDAARDAWMLRARELLEEAGTPADQLQLIMGAEARAEPPVPPLPDRDLTDGERVDVPGWDVTALWAPGHSPGHTCFLLDDGTLLSGDHLLPEITPHIGLYVPSQSDADPLGDYLDSLQRIAKRARGEVLPAHQHRFGDAAGRAEAIVDHHRDRLTELAEACAAMPRTPWELARDLSWNRPWAELVPILRRLALAELYAHLRWLERRGHVQPIGIQPPLRYTASRVPFNAKEEVPRWRTA